MTSSPRITTLLFDAGGTLVHPSWQRIADEFARDGVEVALEALERAEARVRFDLDRPEIVSANADADRWPRYLDNIARASGLSAAPMGAMARLTAYNEEHNLWEHVRPDVSTVLSELATKTRMGLVSNSNGTVRAKFERLGLAGLFEVIVDSREVGFEKPDPRIFHLALARMRAEAGNTAYVGDMYHVDVVGARAAGIEPILYDPLGLQEGRDCLRISTLAELFEFVRSD